MKLDRQQLVAMGHLRLTHLACSLHVTVLLEEYYPILAHTYHEYGGYDGLVDDLTNKHKQLSSHTARVGTSD